MATNPPTITATSAPTNKAVAATGASAFGAAVSILVLYALDKDNHLPAEVRGAITTIVTAILTALAAYYVPPGSGEAVVIRADGKVTTGRTAAAS